MVGCFPVKVKICWEMGGVPRELLFSGSFLGSNGNQIVEQFLTKVLGRLSMPKVSSSLIYKRDQDPRGECITEELTVRAWESGSRQDPQLIFLVPSKEFLFVPPSTGTAVP